MAEIEKVEEAREPPFVPDLDQLISEPARARNVHERSRPS
jgi:hypothetical protein